MAKKKPTPVLTYTELLCLAYRALEGETRHWEEAIAELPPEERHLEEICADQFRKMEAIRALYRLETGTDL